MSKYVLVSKKEIEHLKAREVELMAEVAQRNDNIDFLNEEIDRLTKQISGICEDSTYCAYCKNSYPIHRALRPSLYGCLLECKCANFEEKERK